MVKSKTEKTWSSPLNEILDKVSKEPCCKRPNAFMMPQTDKARTDDAKNKVKIDDGAQIITTLCNFGLVQMQ